MPWVFDPHSGGVKLSPAAQERTRRRILNYAAKHYGGKYTRIDIRFRGALCYVDAYTEPYVAPDWPAKEMGVSREEQIERMRNTPFHLCRLRHFDENRWSVAFYLYSKMKYEASILPNGEWFCTPEEAFEIAAEMHLTD